jgi:hypothetical protein
LKLKAADDRETSLLFKPGGESFPPIPAQPSQYERLGLLDQRVDGFRQVGAVKIKHGTSQRRGDIAGC